MKMAAILFEEGRTEQEVAETLGVTLNSLKATKRSKKFKAVEAQRAESHKSALPGLDGLAIEQRTYTTEELVAWTEKMAPLAMSTLVEIIRDPKAPASTRHSAAQTVFSWQTALQARKAEAEQRTVYHIHFDPAVGERVDTLLQILESYAMKQQLDAANNAVPNSTA